MNLLKITRNGNYCVNKGGEEIVLVCPFNRNYWCGVNCALSGFPSEHKLGNKKSYRLSLCQKEFVFDDFIDERGKPWFIPDEENEDGEEE